MLVYMMFDHVHTIWLIDVVVVIIQVTKSWGVNSCDLCDYVIVSPDHMDYLFQLLIGPL